MRWDFDKDIVYGGAIQSGRYYALRPLIKFWAKPSPQTDHLLPHNDYEALGSLPQSVIHQMAFTIPELTKEGFYLLISRTRNRNKKS